METPQSKSTPSRAGEGQTRRSPWAWIPTLYFAQGVPFVAVNMLSIILYKRLGMSNTEIALYTSWFYLPWVIKPLWSPVVEIFKTKRFWIVFMQLVVGAGLAGVALSIPAGNFVQYTLLFFWLLAFSSATHDIAADGYYMLGLEKHQQAMFVGVRSTFFRLAMITGQGLLVMLAGAIESKTGLPPHSIEVRAELNAPIVSQVDPGALELRLNGELQILSQPESLAIAPVPRDREEVSALIASAREWNRQHRFYAVEEPAPAPEDPTWWQRNISAAWTAWISEPLATALQRWFPREETDPGADAGNIGAVYLYVSGPVPEGEEVVVNFGLSSGDKSLRLVEGERFLFTSENWQQPFIAIVQLDPRLAEETRGVFTARTGNIPLAWSVVFFVMAGFFILFCVYHRLILPRPAADMPAPGKASNAVAAFFGTFVAFFKKPGVLTALAFILLYRFAEAQLVRLAQPFLLDSRETGGLALTTGQVGLVYGTVGVFALLIGGISGGILVSRQGLKFWLPVMVCAINLPNAVYLYLAYAQPDSFYVISACVVLEQFGYGFGFAAFMLYMIYFAEGEQKTAHYAICTGFMALGMMIPGMFSGWIQENIGYQNFFVWILLATLPSFAVVAWAYRKVDPNFGRKMEEAKA